MRFVNVVDLMRLQDESEHPHGLSDRDFDTVFTADKPVIFAYHGYPWLIHRLTYRRTNHENLHVRGYKEEGTTTTPFDMVMMNDLDRYHLVMDVIDRVPGAGLHARGAAPADGDTRHRARAWTREHGEDLPEVRDWSWPKPRPGASPSTTAEPGTRADEDCRSPSTSRPDGRCELLVGGDHQHLTRDSSVLISRGPRCNRVAVRVHHDAERLQPARASARTRATFSPTPPVKTNASAPPSTAR